MPADFDFDALPDAAPVPPAATSPTAPPASGGFDFDELPDAAEPDATATQAPAVRAVPTPQPISLTSLQATHSGVSGDQAAQALKLSKRTGFAPEMVAQNLDTLQQRVDQSGFEDGLGAAPVLADYAAQGPIPAALIKDDVGPLAALEQGLSDLSYGLAATAQSYFPTEFVERGLQGMEADTSAYEKKDEGLIAGGLRQVPTLGFYYAAGVAGARLGGKPGELVANTGAMYLLSRGTLYRKLMQQMPIPASDEEGIIGQGAYDPVEYERKARNYATVGAMASATLATGLSHVVGMATPAVVTRVSALSNNLIARAFTDPATRDVIGNLIGKVVEEEGVKTATGLAGYAGHTLSGTLAMVVSAVAEDATVQEAVKGQIDPSKAAAVAWDSFKHALVAAGILSAIPHVLPAVQATGRAAMAPFDVARLDHNVEQIQAARLPQRNQEEAEKLVGRMASGGDADTVYISPEALQEDPKLAAKVADAAGPHAVGDAQVTGGDVAVPAEKYLVRLGGDHAALRENVKTIEDGATLKEAAEAPKDTMGALMAARSYALQTEPESPERAAKLADIETRMRSVASRGLGMPDTGKGTPEEVAAESAKLEAELKAATEPAATPAAAEGAVPAEAAPSPDKTLKTPKVTVDDEAVAREHIEGKTIGEIRPSYYENAGRRAGDRITKLAKGPDLAAERIFEKYAEALNISLDAVRNAVQGAFSTEPDVGKIGPDRKGEEILKKYAEALNVSLDTVRNAVRGTFTADSLAEARRTLRGAETQANRLESGRMAELKGLEEEYAQHLQERQAKIEGQRNALATARKSLLGAESEANKLETGRMQTLQKLEAEHAMNVANRQLKLLEEVRNQKNAKVFAGVAHDIRNEMDRTEEKLLKKGGDADFLATLMRAGPEYRDAHDALFAAVFGGPEPSPQPGAIDPLLARLRRDAMPLGFDPDHIRALLADPMQWKDLTPAEARNVADAVDNIRTAAKTVNSIALADRRQTLRDFVDGVRGHLDSLGVPDKGLPAPSRAGTGKLERITEGASALNAELLRPETILGRLGPDGERLFDLFVKSRNAKEDFAHQIGEFFTKAYEQDLPKALKKSRTNGVNGPGSPVVNDDKWVRQDLWTLAGWYGSESGADRLRLGLQISDEQIQTVLSQLTKPEADWIDSLHALHDEKLFPLIRDHEVANTGASAPKIQARPFTITLADGEQHTFRGGYWPAKYRGRVAQEVSGDPVSIEDYWGALKNGFPTTSKSFTKERVTRFEGMPDLNWSSYAGHINSVLHYLAYDDFVRNTGKVFQDGEFRNLVERRLGDQEMRELDKFLTVSARGKVEAPTEGAAKWSAMVGGGFRSRVATGAFQLNFPVVLGQLSHIPAAMAGLRIGPLDMLQGIGKAFLPGSWTADHAESQQLPYRWNGYGSHMRDMLSSIGPGDKPLGRKWLDAVGWSLYHTMDGFLSKAIYGAAKAKAESDWITGAGGLRGQEAIDYADRAISRMMPPLNIAEQSSIVRDRGLIGSLLLVRNFPNTLYNVGAVNAWQARTGIWAADPGWQRTKAVLGGTTAAAASYLGMVWSAHIIGRFLMGHGRQEDETTQDWLEREALAAPFYPVPIAGDVAAPFSEAIVSPTKTLQQTISHGLHAAPVIALLEGSIRDFGKAVGDNGTDTDKAFAAAKLAATALRLPVYPLRPARYTLDLFSGEAAPRGPWDVMGGLIYGQRDRQTRNPPTTIQDVASGEFQ